MRTITQSDFDAALLADPAFRGRWSYMGVACERLRGLEGSSLELGPYTLPLVPGGDTMDKRAYPGRCPTHLWDAQVTPWPIANKAYGVFVALQVWEHLGGHQAEAWREVRRIARHAIISVPWKWTRSKFAGHVGINEQTVREWTLHDTPIWSRTVQPGPRRLFQFDLG